MLSFFNQSLHHIFRFLLSLFSFLVANIKLTIAKASSIDTPGCSGHFHKNDIVQSYRSRLWSLRGDNILVQV